MNAPQLPKPGDPDYWGNGCSWLFLSMVLGCVVLMAYCGMPSDSQREGLRWGKGVVEALEAYHRVYGRYPERLVELEPRFLDPQRLPPPPADVDYFQAEGWRYRLGANGYVLRFGYRPRGAGIGECDTLSEHRQWKCGGTI